MRVGMERRFRHGLLLVALLLPCWCLASLSAPSTSLDRLFHFTEVSITSLNATNASSSSSSYRVDYTWERISDYDLTGPYLHGWSLALNDDGSVLAVGSILSNGPYGNALKSGMVTIYQWKHSDNKPQQQAQAVYYDNGTVASSTTTTTSSGQWQTTQLHGLEAGDQCGYSVSLDSTGTVLAMGAPQSSGEGDLANRGQVRVMEYDGTDWKPRGANMESRDDDSMCGYAVALAKDGSAIMSGCPFANNQTGALYTYFWGGGLWSSWGTDHVDGQGDGENSGAAVATNARGTIVAVGAPNQRINGMEQTGSVQVYRYDWDTFSWYARGQLLMGDDAGDKFGYTVAMSESGDVIACGAPYNFGNGNEASGLVRVFIWDAEDGEWRQLGGDIFGSGADDQFGGSLSMSSSGSVIAIGGHLTDTEDRSDCGVVRLFGWDGEDWMQIGSDLSGDKANDFSGWSVALSGDGKLVAIGTPYASGRVRLYRRRDFNVSIAVAPTLKPTEPPTGSDIAGGEVTERPTASISPRSSSTMSPAPTDATDSRPSLNMSQSTKPPFPEVDDAYSGASCPFLQSVSIICTAAATLAALVLATHAL